MKQLFQKSHKLDDVCYEIRGPVMDEARRMEEEGFQILKLNIGNPAPFGFNTPDEILHDIIINLPNAQGYGDSKGIFPARKAVMQYYQAKGVFDADTDYIFIGNGVSELISISLQALLNPEDEVLIPAPDYPLWTAVTRLAGGRPVHYICDEESDWIPDIEDIRRKITSRTKGIVVINPNNPTGAVYPREVLEKIYEIACEHNLVIFSDEIYEKIIYDEDARAAYSPMSLIAEDALCLTFNGLSKAYRAAGLRAGWLMISGKKRPLAKDYIEGISLLSSMRLCSNMTAQFGIQTALGGYQSIDDLVRPGGRLYEQRNLCYELLNQIPGVSCRKPKGALYCFPKLDAERFGIESDELFVLDFLREKKVQVVQGTGFNWPHPDHFRIVFLPDKDTLRDAIGRLADFLADYRQNGAGVA
ncbi:pyridoxal phosphate-dependent aminotransferase [Spirochaeta thermophila]|uniref:alanine transaminase n=1 Tax=Winmispira thermophila (strain ATCC 49972 / DSM 6192 / RI 19.B1) TaxID=665571 RepID=E0RT84_WINT6|nr:pyridoxal phosphate-dependent aminotransferase [Spirochaeta thermophila]ADN02380.1 probable aspartate aminotransferase [Spirochaeta thermophila DSM 6192]